MERKSAEEYSTEKRGLQSLKNDGEISPNDRYMSHRNSKVSAIYYKVHITLTLWKLIKLNLDFKKIIFRTFSNEL